VQDAPRSLAPTALSDDVERAIPLQRDAGIPAHDSRRAADSRRESPAIAVTELVRSASRGAISVAWLELFAHLGEIGAISGFGRGRRELLLGLASAMIAATLIARKLARPARRAAADATLIAGELARPDARRAVDHAPTGMQDHAGTKRTSRARLTPIALTIALLFAPLLCLHDPGVRMLHASSIPALDSFFIALLPASALSWWFTRGRVSLASFVLGMAGAYAAIEMGLLPALGWSAALALIAIAWLACELYCSAARDEFATARDEPPSNAWSVSSSALFAGVWAFVASAAAASARPVLFQRVSAARPGLCAVVAVALIGLWAGAAFAAALRRMSRSPALVFALLVVCVASLWLCFHRIALPVALPPLDAHDARGASAISWRALAQSWAYVGFASVALGAVLGALEPRGHWTSALLVCGACAGTWLGERAILPRWFEPADNARSPLFDLAQHPINGPIEAAAWNPDGIAVRCRTLAAIDSIDMVHWQAEPWERDPSWRSLEDAEVELAREFTPDARSMWIAGHRALPLDPTSLRLDAEHVHVFDPLPSMQDVRAGDGTNPTSLSWMDTGERACVVLLANPREPAGFSLSETSTFLHALEARVVDRGGSVWAWCDPRALNASGATRVLAGWASEFPNARLFVLQDGYAGPLLGLELGGDHRASDKFARILVLAAPASQCIASRERAPSLDWPALEWQASPVASLDTLPRGDVLAAIAAELSAPRSIAAALLMHVLELHARSQVDRPSFQSKWDRVSIEKDEIDAALALVRAKPAFDPGARLLGAIASMLYEKRDYDRLLALAKEAVVLRPDVPIFHHLLGRVRHELLDPEGAIKEYELALALDPGSLVIKSELARVEAELGRWSIAVPLLEEVWRDTTPPDPVIAKALGLGYLEIGKSVEARTLLEFARQAAPADGEIKAALERLDAHK
jgi:tetratricopeptide (TPR) repeat protein